MRNDVASDWFLGIGGEHGRCAVNLRHDLVRYHDSHAELHRQDKKQTGTQSRPNSTDLRGCQTMNDLADFV